MTDLVTEAATAICAALGEEPEGSQVRMLDDGLHAETFLARNRRAALAVLRIVRDQLQAHAEAQPIDDYGRFRPAVEWIDAALRARQR